MNNNSRFSAYKIMWIVVFFDLPTETKDQRRNAADFRKSLIKDGFSMFQYSIYIRHCPSKENMDVHISRVTKFIPYDGKVCILQLTDKQFSEIRIFEGGLKAKPETDAIQLELF